MLVILTVVTLAMLAVVTARRYDRRIVLTPVMVDTDGSDRRAMERRNGIR